MFFLFLIFLTFFEIPLLTENTKLRLAFIIPTGESVTVSNDAMEIAPLGADKTSKVLPT